MISFVDLKAQYKSIKEEIDAVIMSVIEDAAYVGGKYVESFEKEFAKHIGVKHCVSCANGTDSLEILLKSMGITEGDEVIVPAISWISTSEAVTSVGAKPVFVDIDPVFYTIDVNKIEEKINKKTKAIIPVHLYGQPVNMKAVMSIAKSHKLKVLEDCAQAHDAEFEGTKVGLFGDCASFSFYPGKNLGAYGDAGAMVTNDEEIFIKAKMIANHGQMGKHNHLIEGRNSRMDGIQAGILSVKLKYLNQWTRKRREIANLYDESLQNDKVKTPKVIEGGKHVYHLYVIRTADRDEILNSLKINNVSTAIHYPTALPFLKCYAHHNFKAHDFPVASQVCNEIISLPIYPELSNENVFKVASLINEC